MSDNRKAIVDGLTVAITSYGASLFAARGVDPLAAAAGGAISTVSILLVLNKFKYFRSTRLFRNLLYKEVSAYEGYYVSRTESVDRPYSISKIYYSPNSPIWRHRGIALTGAFEPCIRWKSRSIHFDEHRKEWHFDGEWQSIGDESSLHRHLVVSKIDVADSNRIISQIVDSPLSGEALPAPELTRSTMIKVPKEYFRTFFECPPGKIEEVAKFGREKLERFVRQALSI